MAGEGGLIRLLIRGNRLSQAEVAQRAGLSAKHMSRLCSRDTGVSEATAEKLAGILGVHPEVIILAQYLETREKAWDREDREDREDAERKGREGSDE